MPTTYDTSHSRSARCLLTLATAVLALSAAGVCAQAQIHHDAEIRLDPHTSELHVTDRVTVEAGATDALQLAGHLEILSITPGVDIEKLPTEGLQRLRVPAEVSTLEISYRGRYAFALGDQREEYTRGFRETDGLISADGVYLAGSSTWLPSAEEHFATAELSIKGLPASWHVISQGDGTSRDEAGNANWHIDKPMEEIYLVGGPLLRYQAQAGDIETLAYFRKEEAKLARTYLDTTAQYLEMYRRLIGDYPYGKFALVENFWETGYGMPSFTLLGPQVVRFPFILHSSYPHEILHNYWGNGVWVDWTSGNWSEGLTSYLADHLVQEQRGRGAEYRHDTLRKYRDYVQESEDLALRYFRSRHDAVTEAVGYGKTLMGFHMLRRQVGDRAFSRALGDFWKRHAGQRASFDDWRHVLGDASQQDLEAFFVAWVDGVGAPRLLVDELGIADIDYEEIGTDSRERRWKVSGRLRNLGSRWPLQVPIVLTGGGGANLETLVSLEGAEAQFEIETSFAPLRLDIDPDFDLFRLLDARETAPSIGSLFGAPEALAILPTKAAVDAEVGDVDVNINYGNIDYGSMVETWKTDSHVLLAQAADEVSALPSDRSVWIFGRDNPWAQRLGFDADRLAAQPATADELSVIEIRRHPDDPELAVGWIYTDVAAAVPGLIRKLPHYGKYTALAFTGDEPQNVAKLRGTSTDSPLVRDLRPVGDRREPLVARVAAERSALAELPPAFQASDLMATVEKLADPTWQGRGLGTDGLDHAARWLAERFADMDLEPAGDDGTFFQWLETPGPEGVVRTANVVGKRSGTGAELPAVVFGAHYDHLGLGFPDVHAGDEGRIHPGADDNASGVAVLLEVAEAMAGPFLRDLYVVAFTAEEAGRVGSRHFVKMRVKKRVETMADASAEAGLRLHSMVNLDTVGRRGDKAIDVLSSDSAEEWQHIVRGVGFVTGVEGRSVPGVAEASDQKSFLDVGVPAVQLFTGAHGDYHRPSDTADKMTGDDLVEVAVFTSEVVSYLVDRPQPLTSRLTEGEKAAADDRATAPQGGRRVRLGTVPDFAFEGPGVRVDSVSPDSPASRGGLLAGDVLLELDGEAFADLRAYSNLLRRLQPGQAVDLEIRRDSEIMTLQVVLEAR